VFVLHDGEAAKSSVQAADGWWPYYLHELQLKLLRIKLVEFFARVRCSRYERGHSVGCGSLQEVFFAMRRLDLRSTCCPSRATSLARRSAGRARAKTSWTHITKLIHPRRARPN